MSNQVKKLLGVIGLVEMGNGGVKKLEMGGLRIVCHTPPAHA